MIVFKKGPTVLKCLQGTAFSHNKRERKTHA